MKSENGNSVVVVAFANFSLLIFFIQNDEVSMRKIGRVLRWGRVDPKTDERINDYGFIELESGETEENLFVHISQLLFGQEAMAKGLWVTFEEGVGRAGKLQAQRVQRLDDDTSSEVLERCRTSMNRDLFLRTLPDMLKQEGAIAIPYLEDRVLYLPVAIRKTIVQNLDARWLLQSTVLQKTLNPDEHILWLQSLVESGDSLEEVAPLLHALAPVDQMQVLIRAPFNQLNQSRLWEQLDGQRQSNYLAYQIEQNPRYEMVVQFAETIGTGDEAQKWQSEVWARVLAHTPSEWYQDLKLWRAIPITQAVPILVRQLEQEPHYFTPGDFADRITWIANLLPPLSTAIQRTIERLGNDLLLKSPDTLVQHELVWAAIPLEWQWNYLKHQIEKGWINNTVIVLTRAILPTLDEDECDEFVVQLAPNLRFNHFFDYLPWTEQVEMAMPLIVEGKIKEIWQKLSRIAKIGTVYYAAKANLPVIHFKPIAGIEGDWSVRVALKIFDAGSKEDPRQKARLFEQSHQILEDYITTYAWTKTDAIEIDPLLPVCANEVVDYCEGRKWNQKQEQGGVHTTGFCPRKGKECSLKFDYTRFPFTAYSDARLNSYTEQLEWYDWSLHELLDVSGVLPTIPERFPQRYVNWIAGWVNRLNEIRQHLKCSKCQSIMEVGSEWSSPLGRYHIVYASCSEGEGHDLNIYLNHCWCCHNFIDSRQATIKMEGKYLCLHCASGPMYSDDYQQGTICPKCGDKDIKIGAREWQRYCSNHHWFDMPRADKLTGPNSQRMLHNQPKDWQVWREVE